MLYSLFKTIHFVRSYEILKSGAPITKDIILVAVFSNFALLKEYVPIFYRVAYSPGSPTDRASIFP